MNPTTDLEAVIIGRREQLANYAQTPNAKDFYIEKENSLIESLINIYNGIKPLYYQDLWEACEQNIVNFKERDSNFSGVTFEIRFKPQGLLSLQTFNLYDHEI